MKECEFWSREAWTNQNPIWVGTRQSSSVHFFSPCQAGSGDRHEWSTCLFVFMLFLNFHESCVIVFWEDHYLLICSGVKWRKEDRNWFSILQRKFQIAQIHFKAMGTFNVFRVFREFTAHIIIPYILCAHINRAILRLNALLSPDAWQNNIWAFIQLPDPFKCFSHTWAGIFFVQYQVCSFARVCLSENLILSASKAPMG